MKSVTPREALTFLDDPIIHGMGIVRIHDLMGSTGLLTEDEAQEVSRQAHAERTAVALASRTNNTHDAYTAWRRKIIQNYRIALTSKYAEIAND